MRKVRKTNSELGISLLLLAIAGVLIVALLLLNGVCGCGASPTLATDSMDNGSDSGPPEPADMGAADMGAADVSGVLDAGAIPECPLSTMQNGLCKFTPEDCTWSGSCFRCVCLNPTEAWALMFSGCVAGAGVGYPPCGTWLWLRKDGSLCRQEIELACHAGE